MSINGSGIQVSLEGRVLHLMIDNPTMKNALTLDIYRSLTEQLRSAVRDSKVHVILLSGSEGCFTSGNDLANFLSHPNLDSEDHPIACFIRSMHECSKPVVAAVEGPAIGIGTTMLLHCDLVYAGEGAFFQTPFVNLGVTPEFGSSLLLPQLLGYIRAAEMLLLGERVDAKRAEVFGLINRMVAKGQALAVAQEVAARLAEQPPSALLASKKLLKEVTQPLVDEVIPTELRLFSEGLKGPEFSEAIEVFNSRRN